MTEKKKGKKPRKSRLFRCVACESHITHILRVNQETGHRSYRTNCLSKGWIDRNPFRGYPCGKFLQKSSIKLEDFLENPPKNVRREVLSLWGGVK